MGDFPSVELLEAHHDFPGSYMFKAIGRTDNGFVARTVRSKAIVAIRHDGCCWKRLGSLAF